MKETTRTSKMKSSGSFKKLETHCRSERKKRMLLRTKRMKPEASKRTELFPSMLQAVHQILFKRCQWRLRRISLVSTCQPTMAKIDLTAVEPAKINVPPNIVGTVIDMTVPPSDACPVKGSTHTRSTSYNDNNPSLHSPSSRTIAPPLPIMPQDRHSLPPESFRTS